LDIQKIKDSEMKPPTHIADCVKSSVFECDDSILSCDIECNCGGQVFEVLFPGQTHLYQGKEIPCTMEIDFNFFFLIKAKCKKCQSEYLLFDKDYHGWDAFVCGFATSANKPRPPLIPWTCLDCGNGTHNVKVQFCYGDIDQILEELNDFPIDNIADAFEWIYINIECSNCGKETQHWVSYETA